MSRKYHIFLYCFYLLKSQERLETWEMLEGFFKCIFYILLPLHSVSSPLVRKGEDSFYLSCVCTALESKARLKRFQKRWSAEWLRGLYIGLWIYVNTEVLYQVSPDFFSSMQILNWSFKKNFLAPLLLNRMQRTYS